MAKLTVKQLQSLSAEDIGRRLSDESSLYGIVKQKGTSIAVHFRWRYHYGQKLKDYSCGSWPNISLAEIRANRDEARRILLDGIDPAENKRITKLQAQASQIQALNDARSRIHTLEAYKARMTISELFEMWQKRELISRKDKGAEVKRSFEKDVFPTLGTLAVEDVKRAMVVRVLDDVVGRGAKVIARNLLGDLRQMFGFAIAREIIEHDPTSRLKRDDFGKKVERERVLSDLEIQALPDKLIEARLAKSSIATVWIMLATCCRVGEITRAAWVDVDLNDSIWRIPKENSKNGKDHIVYLSNFAVLQLKFLQELSAESEWVLPARWKSGHVDLKSLAKQIGDRQRGDKPPMSCKSGYTNSLEMPGGKWTPHDLRRTGATIMGRLGVRPDVIEKCLNHVEQNKLVRIYQRQKLEKEQSDAWQKLGAHIELLLSPSLNLQEA